MKHLSVKERYLGDIEGKFSAYQQYVIQTNANGTQVTVNKYDISIPMRLYLSSSLLLSLF
jgi:predicted phosphoadenosine phosphosulfate sulfurtransferase